MLTGVHPLSVALAVLVRALVLVVGYAVFVAVLDLSDGTDALGAGLLFFLLVAGLCAAWGAGDAWRQGLLSAVLTWLLVGVVGGFGVVAASVGMDQTGGSLRDELGDSWLFFALLVAVPGVVGALPGGWSHRARGA